MPFEKITIARCTLQEIAKKVHAAYMREQSPSTPERTTPECSMMIALEECIFNIKKEFVCGDWNDCDTEVPELMYYAHMLIKKKGAECDSSRNTYSCLLPFDGESTYCIGYYDGMNKQFSICASYEDRLKVQDAINSNPEAWQCRYIKSEFENGSRLPD